MISRENSGKCSSPLSPAHCNRHLLSLDFTAICSKDLFPSKVSVIVFVLCIGLFINHGILVTASRMEGGRGDSYRYSTSTVVLLTEVVKLVASLLLYFSTSSQRILVRDIVLHYQLFIHYLVPAALYSVSNNLSFLNMTSFDPTTYFLFLQFRVARLSKGKEVDLHFQNICMYFDSIVCNCFLLCIHAAFRRNPEKLASSLVTWESIKEVGKPLVLMLILNNSAAGILTGFFLKTFNSILKTFASALELMFTAVLCWLIFGIPIDYTTVIAIFVVSYAILLYAQNPIKNEHVVSAGSSMRHY
ncbi:unnamed protein product [Cyprideis torosa]|uniref:Uncharacterized protein n=1 Tax=Cyprideis torosa TaxID=163714 RepID=A0A7R8WA26_9CRUS|nr:unnamed protein product [Cyprideis torosa]CAG0889141.1 unnamed protein product [Cyprideis torosa]